MRIFLAGASGAIGRLLVPLLVAAGHDVTGSTRSPEKFAAIAASGARPVALNALDRDGLAATLRAERPDVLIHMLTDLAGLDYAANTQLRLEGSRNLVDAARAAGTQRLIGESISWVYAPGVGPATEDQPLDLDAPLPRGRMVGVVHSAEQAAAEMPHSVMLRFGIFYGPGTWYARDGHTTEQIRRGEIEATNAVTSFIHVADAAQAVLQALEWPSGVVNIVDDEPAPGTKWVPLYASLVGAPPPPVKHSARPWERGESNAKARGRGWRPTFATWRDGFELGIGLTHSAALAAIHGQCVLILLPLDPRQHYVAAASPATSPRCQPLLFEILPVKTTIATTATSEVTPAAYPVRAPTTRVCRSSSAH